MIVSASLSAAKEWFGRYHYTGTTSGHRFFNYADCAMIAVGRGSNRFGVQGKFALSRWVGNIEITRVACLPGAPRNTASAAISAMCGVLAAEGVDWLFSYADSAHGHHGGIYQAVNAVFVGTDAKQWVNFELDGLRVSKRKVSGMFGHTRCPEVIALAAARGLLLRRVAWFPKFTYILPIGRYSKRPIRRHLASYSLPYPKRGPELTKAATPYRNSRREIKI